MKLKNKKTGELGYFCFANWDSPVIIITDNNGIQLAKYNSLAELNEEWEDYEEPKEFWYISDFGFIFKYEITERTVKSTIEEMKSIGNYFETKKEAEKAVEKLKAWKRLEDKGFRFNGGDDACISYRLDPAKWDELEKDFDLLFGGEE